MGQEFSIYLAILRSNDSDLKTMLFKTSNRMKEAPAAFPCEG
jgi:hypothetical protein